MGESLIMKMREEGPWTGKEMLYQRDQFAGGAPSLAQVYAESEPKDDGINRMSKHAWEKMKKDVVEDGDPDNIFGNPWDVKNHNNSNPVTWKTGVPQRYMHEPLDTDKLKGGVK